uniref:General secretion pathway protein F n=1 Tax=uncultured marine bacterium MedDCM-OCT-S01-C143 TaxID=743046 RepID=D6PCC0_9BACT|nr:general secretion pathway protein F [uncultured marine bacterium MedDCM-OCT-S01-C143]
MPIFSYKGYSREGRAMAGTLEAENSKVLKVQLRRDGVFVTELKESKTKKRGKGAEGRTNIFAGLNEGVSALELAVATRQLATLVGAGIPLVQSLTALVDQIEAPRFKAVWADVKTRVNEGVGMGDAMAAYPRYFSNLYVSMVRAGESSGALEIVLERLADFTESQADLRGKLIGAMIYPMIMVVVAIAVVAMLFTVVVPKIATVFESQKVALPLVTRVLISLSEFSQDYGGWILLFAPVLIYGFRRYIASKRGKPVWDRFVLGVPYFGPLVRMVAIARFSKTLGTLISSGVPLLKAFDIVQAVVQNHALMAVIGAARDAVKEGESIAQPLKRSGQFPPLVTHMIAVGEKSGQLEEMLNNIAKTYDSQVNTRLQGLTSVLEPILLVGMGVVVAFIVFAVLIPMMKLTSLAG